MSLGWPSHTSSAGPTGQVASDHGYIEEAIAVEIAGGGYVRRAGTFQSSKEWRVHPPEASRRHRAKP